MIGLVVVSHSRALARAAVELAVGLLPAQSIRIEMAAGSYGNELGTDAESVAQAIAAADSGDGVLVLMDLGSAVLSADTALELLEPTISVRLSAAPLVEGLVAALATASGGASLDEVAAAADQALDAKRIQLTDTGGTAGRGDAGSRDHSATTETLSTATVSAATTAACTVATDMDGTAVQAQAAAVFDVTGTHGLHARPAAELVAALRTLDAVVRLSNATTGAGPVPATSLTSLLTLDVRAGHRLEVTATGPAAMTAVDRVRAIATRP
ncbi:dihydroxyacetone kinase phosphoryl donor subunit DhaM [Nocardia sp. NPDC057668]|uniref:dihydroxyacetone kinase phosphoryl donor subunit DhaM n=1 Tax=Nocardia sp. NPDC057668 TaxID=3346202 RepID=UPI00366FEED0